MKRRETTIEIGTARRAVETILQDPAQFITNWPYVVKVRGKSPVVAEIMLPRFVFKFRDTYEFEFHEDYNSHIYEGTGRRGTLTVAITLKEWQKKTAVSVELSYSGKREFLLGKPLELLTEGIAKSLKELAESFGVHRLSEKTEEAIVEVDFSDPMSVANFLAKAKMFHSGLHVIAEGRIFELLHDLMEKAGSEVLYVSGVTSDGTKGFKVLMRGTQIMAVEVRGGEVRTIKVVDEKSAREAVSLLSGISGAYMLNAWIPAGGV
ncbi:hypothetical protein [Thermococcus sp. AM4]|uniref:hypothetical protein n=1 Tax=Thermococcus sp. (strain AM4) TaxID=246969 RepID=UPI0001870214|nr:hypothetical protein [Thermococcus sp. AM4]EEB74854.1 hypothetical protein TAM4_799 [Thermococcus sp. AM4]